VLLRSVSIPAGSVIARRHAEPAAGGQNLSPDLAWSGAPADTRSYAITCFDPDAPGSGWWHWIAVDLPASVTSVADGAKLPAPAREWTNDYGYPGYGGPCPPRGPAHRYVFTVHALDVERLDLPDDADPAACRAALLAHSLADASFTATFRR
jgi:Raf kinase inhibitor-like YbhB/YbcL family protein